MHKFHIYLITIISLLIIKSNQITTKNSKAILLYHVANNESVKIIDKGNRISYLNDNNGVYDLDVDSNADNLPKLYNVLFSNENYVLIGTHERIVNISLSDADFNIEFDKIHWESRNNYRRRCFHSENPELLYTCHNYITAAIPLNNSFIICGTNSSIPYCRRYTKNFELIHEFKQPQFSALNRITSNNYFNARQTPPFVADDSIYFVNSGSYTIEPTINKQVLRDKRFSTLIKTPKGALKNAVFKSSFTHNDKAYFFFYETESIMDIKNGLTFKTPFSLIGEVCKNDNGKSSYLENFNRFITFKKAVIYCYLPDYQDGFHVKYTEIQAVSKPIKLNENNENEYFYAIFTFRRLNSVDSALCKYKISTVQDTMTGYFKSSDHNDRIHFKKPMSSCDEYKQMSDVDLKRYYNDRTKNYNFQMEQTVNEPALFALNNIKFTSIAVDSPSQRNNFNEVIFIGLEDGRIIKLLMRPTKITKDGKNLQQPVIVQEYRLFESAVTSIIIKSGKLIATSNENIRSIYLDTACFEQSRSCGECLNAQDPYCAWSNYDSKCISLASISFLDKNTVGVTQDINANKCFNVTGNINDLLFSENEEITEMRNSYERGLYDANGLAYAEYSKSVNVKSMETGNLLVAIFLTALLTCLLSVGLTCLLINKRYKMADYLSRHLSTTLSSNRSTSSSTTSYNNYKVDNKYLSTNNNSKTKPKYQNFYESSLKPLLDNSLFSKKANIQNTRYDSPTVNTNMNSSTDCTQHSPNSELTQPKSINDTLSSSNESCCFDPQSISDECHVHTNCDRYNKRPYSSPINSKKSTSHIESIKVDFNAKTDSNV